MRSLLLLLTSLIAPASLLAQSGTFDFNGATTSGDGKDRVVQQTVSSVEISVGSPVGMFHLPFAVIGGPAAAASSSATSSLTLSFDSDVNISTLRIGCGNGQGSRNMTFTSNTGGSVTENNVTCGTSAGATAVLNFVNVNQIDVTTSPNAAFIVTNVVMDGSLPVELIDFIATTDGDRAHLAWQTASETNNAGFQIEHQPTGTAAWHTLGFTPGHGTTLEAQRYTYTADGLTPGTHRFRLTQVDYDGTFDYSPEIEVSIEIADAFNLSQVYPNPFNPEASVTLSVRERQQVRVTVYDLLGREVARLFDGELASQKGQLLRLDGSQWTSGLYVVRAVGERFTATQVVTLLK
ncbi:MAG: hypothetical protein RhofKO_17030 [Rhodothermales bacterium]